MDIRVIGDINQEIRNRVVQIHKEQVIAFGGYIKGHELKEIFKKDGYICVRFENGDWYHYDLLNGTWW